MSAPESSRRVAVPDAGPGFVLRATRRLGVLDELRVPYAVVAAPHPASWQLITAEPGSAMHWYTGEAGVAGAFRLGEIPLWGRVAPDHVVADHVATLGGVWTRRETILGVDGRHHSSVWAGPDGATLLPFDPDELVLTLRSERYRELSGGSSLKGAVARRGYYAVRPLLPRRVQIALRRAFSRIQARTAFPRWPFEPALHDLEALVAGSVAGAAHQPLPCIASWPDGHEWAIVLTHDVETAIGRDAIGRVRAVEEAAGFRSSWNLVPERYTVDDALVADLQAGGNEVGVHGLRHDGRDLESLATLGERLPEMRRWAERWGAAGFRSPATHRRWEWMPRLGFDYDTSSPDTDPFEPMAGGCCSWLPFFNEDLVELPITLPQDHTLFAILRRGGELWREKTERLRRRGGMSLIIVHPDYMLEDAPLAAYASFLDAYRDDPTAWRALPHEVSAWWRARAATTLRFEAGHWSATGPAERRARVALVHPRPGGTR